MTLQYQLDSLEGLDEVTAKLYTERDGKFILDVDIPTQKNDKDTIPLSRLQQEIEKRKSSDAALTELADELKEDIPEEKHDLIPDLPPLKLVKWIRKAMGQGLFDEKKEAGSIDSKRANDKTPKDFEGMSPQSIMATGYKTK